MKYPLAAYFCGKGVFALEQYYDVKWDGKPVGTVTLSTEGLYYSIHCRVKKPGIRLYLRTSETTLDLGVCIPVENGFGFHIRKPIKSVPGTVLEFYVSEKKTNMYLIDPTKPFAHIQAVMQGRLHIENGKYYLKEN